MSTKCTIDHGPNHYLGEKTPEGVDYHIYYECADEDNIYLEIRNPNKVTIAIPGKLWNHIVRLGELKSWGGEDFDNPKSPEERKKDWEESMETFNWSFRKGEDNDSQ